MRVRCDFCIPCLVSSEEPSAPFFFRCSVCTPFFFSSKRLLELALLHSLVRNIETFCVEAQSLPPLTPIKAEVLEVVRYATQLASRIGRHKCLNCLFTTLGYQLERGGFAGSCI